MPNVYTSLADLVKINNMNLADLDVTDLLQDAPLMAALAADVASNGTEHKYLKETGAPVVGFRAANDGRENQASSDTLVTITLQILDASHAVDKALADAYRKGADAYVARECKRHLKAAFAAAEAQLISGVGASAAGFVGLCDATTIDAIADAMVINATGTTAATGSSVIAIRTNDDGNDCTVITGNDGELTMGETTVQRLAGATGFYPAYYTPMLGWLALQIGSAYSVGRICNLTAQAGKTLTDALISQLLALFPASKPPNLLVMSRRSRQQLQASRTATTMTGAPAPIPEDSFGVPILVTDGMPNTQAILV